MSHLYSSVRALLSLAAAFLLALASGAEAQTLHDTPFQALPLYGDGSYSYTGDGATAEPDGFYPQLNQPSACSGANDGLNTVFATLRPTANAPLTADLLGSTFDTILSVWTIDGTEIACNDDSGRAGDLTSRLENVSLIAGTLYFVRVTGFQGASGEITMDIQGGGTLVHPNSTINGPGGVITFGDRAYFNWNFNTPVLPASAEPSASCTSGDSGHSVWYAINLTGPLTLVLETEQSTFDPILSVYSPNRTELGCNDDGGEGVNSKLIVSLPQGQSYIRVSGHVNNPEGSFFLSVNPGSTVATEEVIASSEVELSPVYPNPVSSQATVDYRLSKAGTVRLAVFDVLGREVSALVSGDILAAGDHTTSLDASALPSGLYMVRLEAGGVMVTKALTVAH